MSAKSGYSSDAALTPAERKAEAGLPEPPHAGAAERPLARYKIHPASRGEAEETKRRVFFARRAPMENTATAIIGAGFLMMFQPFVLSLYTYSFITLLAGTVMFIIVSKFPE